MIPRGAPSRPGGLAADPDGFSGPEAVNAAARSSSETLAERCEVARRRRRPVDEPDGWRRLLSVRRKQPCRGTGAEQGDKLTPFELTELHSRP
jgi:hypothetical protein